MQAFFLVVKCREEPQTLNPNVVFLTSADPIAVPTLNSHGLPTYGALSFMAKLE